MSDDAKPTRDEIATWLADQKIPEPRRADWARALDGLPWRYIRPIVTIAVQMGQHPMVVMGAAAEFSTDRLFVAAARRQVRRLGGST